MNPDDVARLVDYHYWARDRMLAALESLPSEAYLAPRGNSFGSIRDTVVHTFFAEWVWLQRWNGVSPTSGLDPLDYPDVAAIRGAWTAHEAQLRAHVQGLDASRLQEVVAYTLLSGAASASPRWAMIQHVVNHATYHRGQVTTLIRQAGGTPPASQDLITYYREAGV